MFLKIKRPNYLTQEVIDDDEFGKLYNLCIYYNIYIQQDATLHSLFYLETVLHVSGGTSTHHQERKQLYLQHLVLSDRYCYLPL